MTAELTIGDFSRITHLSIKALRHYHQVGLLEPAEINASTGYRYYRVEQVRTAQTIRRFRDLDMPVDEVRAVLNAPDTRARDALIAAHLDRMQAQLDQTQAAVASLRRLLQHPDTTLAIQRRSDPAMLAVAIHATVTREDLDRWWSDAMKDLFDLVRRTGSHQLGPAGGLYADELFTRERGAATLYIPVSEAPGEYAFTVPAADFAVATYGGAHDDADRIYGALGSYVAEHRIGAAGLPVRERYLIGPHETSDATRWKTEIAWPVKQR